jgi:uncharacterized repeat protein (TIGR01451 family)
MSSMGLGRRRRNLWVVAAALAGGLIFFVAGALADAGNPILGTIKGTAVNNGNGTITIYVRGQYNWLSHNTDCNFDRAATGVGIIWGDSTEPGFTVTKGAISAGVGISQLRQGDAVNTVDPMVHPVDRGNQVEGYTAGTWMSTAQGYPVNAAGDFPSGQLFVDPASNNPNDFATWKGGCGREPLTATASKGANPERSGVDCGDPALAGNPPGCSGHPWGSWGYEKNGGLGYSHTYLATNLPTQVCVNFYDVHGGGKFNDPKFQLPDSADWITVNKNTDNSIETNSFNVNNGANCISVVTPTLTTVATDGKVGDPISDTAALSGLPAGSHGTLSFKAFGPRDPAVNPNPNCTGAPVYDRSGANAVAVNGNGSYNSGNFIPNAAGTYDWLVQYSGDPNNLVLPVDSTCGDTSGGNKEISIVSKLNSTTRTDIHNAAHQIVTAVERGSTVHDFVTVTGEPNKPIPSGNVTIDWFLNGACTGAPQSNSGNVPLDATGHVDATAFAFTVNNPGLRAFKAHYLGNANVYNPSDGSCEPLRVVDANIQITPASATNRIGTNHTLTGHVNVNDGTGEINAPDATTISFAIVSGPGSFVGPNSCATSGGTGSCSVVISSSTSGTTTVRASTNVTVAGVALHRESGDGKAGDSADATKAWATAKIEIAPSATNEIGKPHTFTVTLSKDTGTGTFVAAPGEHVDVTLTDTSGAVHTAATGTCTNAGSNTDASGQCTITFSSPTPGMVTAHASATLSINGATVAVETDGTGSNGGNAVKTFVDANIQLNPPSAINPVSTNHVLTAHVNVNGGTGFASAPNGTQISFTIDSGPGSLTTANPCTTAGGTGSCSITLTSATPGTTVVSAHVTLNVGGVTLKRDTNGTAGNSGAATKLFADDTARTDILNAADGVVTSVVSGTIVHDKVFVAKTGTTPVAVPNPTGSVVFHRYATIDCTGAATNQTVVLTSGAPSTAVSDAFAPTANMSYSADYLGDANYPARSGACEPLTVTPVPAPAIAIVKNPKSQTVANGGTATFTITVTNAGNVTLTNVTVTDPLSPNCNRTSAQIPALASMAPGATVTYTCTRPTVRANFDNVATATGTPPSGPNVTASDTAPVKVAPLTPPPTKVVPKKHPKVISHKKPKATG